MRSQIYNYLAVELVEGAGDVGLVGYLNLLSGLPGAGEFFLLLTCLPFLGDNMMTTLSLRFDCGNTITCFFLGLDLGLDAVFLVVLLLGIAPAQRRQSRRRR